MAVVFSDDFNRANSDSLGGNWVEYSGDADIVSNKLEGIATAIVYNSTSVGQADYQVLMDFDWDQGDGDEWVIPFVRGATSGSPYDTAYLAYFQASTGTDFHLLLRRLSGSQAQLGSTNNTQYTGMHTVGVRVEGTSINAIVDGSDTISVTDSNISIEGRHGFRIDASSEIDNYEVDDLTASDAGTLRVNIGQSGTGIRII